MQFLTGAIKNYFRSQLLERGYISNYYVREFKDTFQYFHDHAEEIIVRHDNQSPETVAALAKKYEEPLFGEIEVYRLLELLAQVIDPTNRGLYCVSQLTHTLHVVEDLADAGITDEDMMRASFVHDLGKLALLTGEAPEHVEGNGKKPIGAHEPGCGLDNATLTWDHGEIVYVRMKPFLSEACAWLVRHHSINMVCLPLMDDCDRYYYERYLKPFRAVDQNYMFFRKPRTQLSAHRETIEALFPEPIVF